MGKVHLLPPEIISKIAAGEVIERPASVVKELMENSLDAGATNIEINLKGAGKSLIHIKDNGSGISGEDIEQIFQRHATSKISKLDDLFAIGSLGFRGEALYSIAAISDITLQSKSKTPPSLKAKGRGDAQDTGWEIHLRGTERLSLKPMNRPVGTEIEIKELFFNTPARRKFLKTDSAELTQILNIFLPYTINHPQCRFLLQHSGKPLLDLQPSATSIERAALALNLKAEDMLGAEQRYPEQNLSFRLILGNINIQRSRKDLQFIFVNGRPVQNRALSFHVNDVYRVIFPPETYPFFILFIDIPPEDVDVNVHPTKREVKLKDESAIAALLRPLCEQTLMRRGTAKAIKENIFLLPPANVTPAPSFTLEVTSSLQEISPTKSYLPFESPIDPNTYAEVAVPKQYDEATPPRPLPIEEAENIFSPTKKDLRSRLAQARFIGTFIRKYLLFESGHSLFVVDQHAAQERINFEKLKKQIENNQVEVQHLLSPLLLRLSVGEVLAFALAQEKLETMRISATAWDKETIAVHAHPILLDNPELTVRQILAERSAKTFNYHTLATRACRQSVMTGDKMSPKEADYQLKELTLCHDPFTCPHGRPTVVEVKEKFLDRQFLRV